MGSNSTRPKGSSMAHPHMSFLRSASTLLLHMDEVPARGAALVPRRTRGGAAPHRNATGCAIETCSRRIAQRERRHIATSSQSGSSLSSPCGEKDWLPPR